MSSFVSQAFFGEESYQGRCLFWGLVPDAKYVVDHVFVVMSQMQKCTSEGAMWKVKNRVPAGRVL